MTRNMLLFLLSAALLGACRDSAQKKGETENLPTETTVPGAAAEAQGYTGETRTSWEYCFASRTPTPPEFGEAYNYQFLRFQVDKEGNLTGTTLSAPYGTDGSRGSFTGVYREDEKRVQTTTVSLAEGELYEEPRDYRLGAEGLTLLDARGEAVFTIPAVSCEQYGAYLKEYRQGILKNRVNTTDRTRLKNVKEIMAMGYSGEQLENLRFLELAVDLDHNYETEEYLLYLMDPMVCGSGGCTLFVIDGKGNTLSQTTVVKLPIYMPVSTIAGAAGEGTWKPLYVWSQGFRELVPEGGRYPANASMAPEVPEDTLEGHPERFVLVLDYLD